VADCKRHRWTVERTNAIEKKGPTGHPSGFYGIYEFLRCSKCNAHGLGRFAKGINERTPSAARRAYDAVNYPFGVAPSDGSQR
jgi:hypothetical protein